MTDFQAARINMVKSQILPNRVTDPRVLSVMGDVAREAFVPPARRSLAYVEKALLVREAGDGGPERFLMAAGTFARLVQLADIARDDLVLDVGCATGYSSAVLSMLGDAVVALECDSTLAEKANETLMSLDIGNVAVVTGDLPKGYPGEGPYDVIVLNGSVPQAPSALLSQLGDGGRLVGIVADGATSRAWCFVRHGDVVSGNIAFEAGAAPLPGFEKEPEFVF